MCSNYRLRLHSYDSLYMYVRVFNNIYNKTSRFRSGIIHNILNYCYKISFLKYAMQILILPTTSIACIYLSMVFNLWYLSGTSSVTINTTEYHTYSCYNKKTESSRIHSLMFAVIGLTSVSVLIYIVYFYIRMLEKRQTNTGMFTGWKSAI